MDGHPDEPSRQSSFVFTLCSNPDARAHTHEKRRTHADYEPVGELLSRLHYARVASLECVAVDNDGMIRGGFFRGRGFVRADWLLLRGDNKLPVPGWRAGALKLMFHVGPLPELTDSPMHVRAKAIDGNTRAPLMILSKKPVDN